MQFLFMALFAAGVVAADQITKYLTVANIALYQDVEFIPGILGFTYVQNTGAAFSSFEGQQWLFAVIFLVFTVAILYEYFKKPWLSPNSSAGASRPSTAAAWAICSTGSAMAMWWT